MADTSIDILLRHQVYLQRFGSHEANQFESYLKDADKIIRDILSRYPDEIPTKADLNDIGRELRARIDPVYSAYTEQLMLDLEGLSGSEADYTVAAIDDDLVADVDSVEHSSVWRQTLARPVTTGTTARFMQAMLSDFTAQEIDRVNQVVVSGFYEGKTTSQIARSIRGTKKNRFTDGILNVTSRNAGVIARTAVNHTATQAKMAVYKKNGRLIKGWVFSATLDSRTSGICRGLHGTEWPTGEGPEPPQHFACRSATLPSYDKRLSLMGDVPMNQASVGADGAEVVRAPDNYYEWLKTQPLYFQQDVIGKTKTKLLNDGGLTTEEFRKLTITNFGDPLTLDEMRAKDAKAFDKAGV